MRSHFDRGAESGKGIRTKIWVIARLGSAVGFGDTPSHLVKAGALARPAIGVSTPNKPREKPGTRNIGQSSPASKHACARPSKRGYTPPIMRIAFTSDIHADLTQQNRLLVPHLVRVVESLAPDVFAIAGDVANTAAGLESTLTAFSALSCQKLLVPGNHDVWVESRRSVRKGRDSRHKHDTALPMICGNTSFTFLPGRPVVLGDVALVGSLG